MLVTEALTGENQSPNHFFSLSFFEWAALNWSVAFFIQLALYLGYRWCYCHGLLHPTEFLNDWERRMKTKKRGGLDSSNPFCWVSMATGYDLLWINRGIWVFAAREHTHSHTILQTFCAPTYIWCYLLQSLQFNSLIHIHTLFVMQRFLSFIPTHLSPPCISLHLSLRLSLAYTQSLINISNFGRSSYFEISTLLRPQASPVSSLPSLPSLSPGSQTLMWL